MVAKPAKVVAKPAKVVAKQAKVVAKPAKARMMTAKPAKATNKRSAEGASGGHSGEVGSSFTFQLSSLYAVHCSGSSE